jgi:hypothetical protein
VRHTTIYENRSILFLTHGGTAQGPFPTHDAIRVN